MNVDDEQGIIIDFMSPSNGNLRSEQDALE